MVGGIGDGIEAMFNLMGIIIIVSVPLAIWKAIEIIVWIFKHVSIGVN